MGDVYIFSTATAGTKYTIYYDSPAKGKEKEAVPRVVKQGILIAGGAGVANKNFVTPLGVMTRVTEQQFDALSKVRTFNRHVERGFITVEDKPYEIEKVVPDMAQRDGASPLRAEDFTLTEGANGDPKNPPTTGIVGK